MTFLEQFWGTSIIMSNIIYHKMYTSYDDDNKNNNDDHDSDNNNVSKYPDILLKIFPKRFQKLSGNTQISIARLSYFNVVRHFERI